MSWGWTLTTYDYSLLLCSTRNCRSGRDSKVVAKAWPGRTWSQAISSCLPPDTNPNPSLSVRNLAVSNEELAAVSAESQTDVRGCKGTVTVKTAGFFFQPRRTHGIAAITFHVEVFSKFDLIGHGGPSVTTRERNKDGVGCCSVSLPKVPKRHRNRPAFQTQNASNQHQLQCMFDNLYSNFWVQMSSRDNIAQ